MQRITHNLAQGSESWHQHRQSHYNASDAATMMGLGKYRTRAALLREKATGIAEEVSDAQQRLFDRGHAAEAAIRPAIEKMVEEDLYPVTMSVNVDGLPLSASLDGQTLLGETLFECKLWNEKLAAQVRAGELEPHYYWQMEQQLLVSGAERVIFATGDGEDRLETMEYRAVPGRAEELIAAWKQFADDVAAHVPESAIPAATGITPDALPVLSVVARGMVEFSNLEEFREKALAAIGSVNRDLQTDDDFATAELTIKAFKSGEEKLDATKRQVLGQMADVDAVMRTIDEVSEQMRRVRLDLDKLVKAEKESRKGEIVTEGRRAVCTHYDAINATLGEHRFQPPQTLSLDLGGAIKGKKSLSSMRDAVDAAVANAKITASQQAERVRANVAILAEAGDHATLFADRVQLCAGKAPEDLRNLVAARISEHQQREAERLEKERARIRQEEADRLEREQREEAARVERERAAEELANAKQSPGAELSPAAQKLNEAEGAKTFAERHPSVAKPTKPGARIKLGDICARIAPLTITADGLASLGFNPVASERGAKLYTLASLPAMFDAMTAVLSRAADHRKAA